MPELPILSGKELILALENIGTDKCAGGGSHIRLSCPARKSITVRNYKTIDRALLKKILLDAELTAPDLGGCSTNSGLHRPDGASPRGH